MHTGGTMEHQLDTLAMLEELLEQNQFELLLTEEKNTGGQKFKIRLVYLMNDAVESFLVFHDARMTGHYDPEYEGELEASLSRQQDSKGEAEYVLWVRQEDSVVTLFFRTVTAEVHLYDYGETGHFWIRGYEYLRQLEYRIAILHDKKEYLGEEFCTPEENRLAELVAFPPLNYCCYSAVPEQYMVPRSEPWEVTPEALSVMENLSEEAGDHALTKALKQYRNNPSERMARRIAAMLHKTAHETVITLLQEKLRREAANYPKRKFKEAIEKRRDILNEKAKKRQQELQKQGICSEIVREEPFTTAEDDLAFRLYLMMHQKRLFDHTVSVEEIKEA